MKTSTTSFCLLILLIANPADGFDVKDASAQFISELNTADSIYSCFSQDEIFNYGSKSYIDSLFKNALLKNPQLYAAIKVNQYGEVVSDINRDSSVNSNKNVRNKNWFQIPFFKAVDFNAGIVSANSRLCFLKTYPLFENSENSETSGVLAILIDISYCLNKLKEHCSSPFALFYDSSIIYQSNPDKSFLPVKIPQYGRMELVFFEERGDSILPNVVTKEKYPRPAFTWMLIVILIPAIIVITRFIRPKINREELVALEYKNLPEETHKLIHDRAVSQLYCEIKRQLELHESVKIEQEIRNKLHSEIEKKITENHKSSNQ